MNMMLDTASRLVEKAQGRDVEDTQSVVMGQLSIDPGFDAEFYAQAKPQDIEDKLFNNMEEVYKRRMENLINKVYPFLKEVYEKQGKMYENIAIPISDGRKMLNLSVNLEKAYNTQGREIAKTLSKTIILWQIDEHWKQHLRDMDNLRQSVQNAAYEQKDPLVVYKLESYNLFADMLDTLNKDVLSFLLRAFIPLRDDAPRGPQRPTQPRRTDMSQMQTSRNDLSTNGEQKSNAPVVAEKRVGRNDPCPCGSGKKYKNCHGKGLV
jgi:preprotein translocase subunit SecA